MIAVIDYGLGNVRSIANMLTRAGASPLVTGNPDDIAVADGLILPGVGAWDNGMRRLTASGLVPLVRDRVFDHGVPILGICLGMQLLGRRSAEGTEAGLGWLDAETVPLSASGLPVPHMGWDYVTRPDGAVQALFDGEETPMRFYFLHSYRMACDRAEDVLAETEYGERFPCAIGRGQVMGVQFHPEKSHRYGLRLLSRFADLAGSLTRS